MRYRVLTTALIALLCCAAPASVMAQGASVDDANRAAARDLGKEGIKAYEAGDYQTALDKFQRAHQLVGLTTTGLFTARCLEKLGRLVQASELYLEVSRMTVADDALEQHKQAVDDARKEREALLPRIPKLTISVEAPDGANISVTLDGRQLPTALLDAKRPTDPGEHVVVARAGETEERATVALAEGQDEYVTLTLRADAAVEPGPPLPPGEVEPKPNEPDLQADGGSSLSTLGWVAIAVGGAGLVVGAVGAGLAASKKSELEDSCPNNLCTPEFHDDVDALDTLRLMSSVGFIAGGVIAATGIVLVIAAPSGSEQTALQLTPYATPAGAGLLGQF